MDQETKKNEVQTTGSNVPDFLRTEGDLGTDEIGTQDIIVPRLKVCQAMSTVKQTNEDVRDGDFYNAATGRVYGKEIEFFILLMWRSRIWFNDQMQLIGMEMLDKRTKEVKHIGLEIENIINNKALYDKGIDSHNYMLVMADDLAKGSPEILIYSAQSAAMKTSRQLNSKLAANARGKVPIYGQRIKCAATLQKFSKGSAYMPVFSYPAYATEQEFPVLKQLFEQASSLQGRDDVMTQESPTDRDNPPPKDAPIDANDMFSEPGSDPFYNE